MSLKSEFVMKTMRGVGAIIAAMIISNVSLANESSSSYILTVAGLSCPFCTYGVEKELNAIEGVESIETSLNTGTVVVTMRDGVPLDEAMANNAVEAAGFSLNAFEPSAATR